MTRSRFGTVLLLSLICCSTLRAATPTAAISASPSTGQEPLPVFFDGSASSSDTVSYLWNFGDGGVSSAKSPSHIYNVAGTYTATLTVTNATGATNTSQVTITVLGSGQGSVTSNMNFRWAPFNSKFNLTSSSHDKFVMNAFFNTVDLPDKLKGLAASFSINNTFTVSGVIGDQGGFQNPGHTTPRFVVQLVPKEQTLMVGITNADFSKALTGIVGGKVPAGSKIPVTFTLTVGAQTYQITENFQFTGNQGVFNLKKSLGVINDGFFVVNLATALESLNGAAHQYEFDTLLTEPMLKILQKPTSGNFTFTLNSADPIVVPFDRFKQNGSNISYLQGDRDVGGIRSVIIDTAARRMTLKSWDILAAVSKGGTGLPLRGDPFVGFNFTLRIDFDQPDGTTFQAVTATRLTRRSRDDAVWQTGRRNKLQ
jgi:PKD repeat protein